MPNRLYGIEEELFLKEKVNCDTKDPITLSGTGLWLWKAMAMESQIGGLIVDSNVLDLSKEKVRKMSDP